MGRTSSLRQHHNSSMHANSTNTAAVTMELLKGKETAIRLQNLLGLRQPPPPSDHHHVSAAEDLALQILKSFTHTLSLLTTSRRAASTRDRRGCYKRRRSSDSRVTISPVMGDNYSWRKYGQKIILNSEYPRCYFRCTNKYDRGCKATKQVQIIQENPIMYQTTYFDLHTCSSTTDDDDDDEDEAPITTSAPPPTGVLGSDLPDHDQPDPTNTTTEVDIIHNSVSETDTSQLQYQWLDFTGPEYQPDQAPLPTGSYREEGFHSIDMDVNGFGDIDNFYLDQIF